MRKMTISIGLALLSFLLNPALVQAEKIAEDNVVQENTNLLKNSELKFDNDGKLLSWSANSKLIREAGYKGLNSVRIALDHQAAVFIQNTMSQQIKNLKPGKYIFTAYIKLDRKISEVVLMNFFTLDGKVVYQGPHLKASEQPEPGEWGKVMAEFDIPQGTDSASFAFDLRDASPGAFVWIDSPVLTRKLE